MKQGKPISKVEKRKHRLATLLTVMVFFLVGLTSSGIDPVFESQPHQQKIYRAAYYVPSLHAANIQFRGLL